MRPDLPVLHEDVRTRDEMRCHLEERGFSVEFADRCVTLLLNRGFVIPWGLTRDGDMLYEPKYRIGVVAYQS